MSVSFEPFAAELREDPYPHYKVLRDESPVVFAPEANCWCVSRYEDVALVLNDTETFSSHGMRVMLMQGGREGPPELGWDVIRFVAKMLWHTRMHPKGFGEARGLIMEDGAAHAETRNIVNRGFTPRGIASWEPRVHQVAASCLEGARASGRLEVVQELAVPLPLTLITELLGIEPERREQFKRWTDAIVESISTPAGRSDLFAREFVDVFIEMAVYFKRAARDRRQSPRNDLISAIVSEGAGEMALNDYDVLTFVIVLLVAGNETTTNLIGNAINALYDHPSQLEKLIANPGGIEAALEETLRFDGPVQMVFRQTTRETRIRGVRIGPGERVAAILGSANRDERQFPEPDVYDIERHPQGHLAFGFGKHFCLGSALARLEARCALEALLPMFSQMERMDSSRERVDSFLVRGPRRIQLVSRDAQVPALGA